MVEPVETLVEPPLAVEPVETPVEPPLVVEPVETPVEPPLLVEPVETPRSTPVTILAGVTAHPDPARPAASGPLRDRLIDAAVRLTTEQGWARVTMARLADQVGVSRQTVYNEIGTKGDLAEAMVLRELDRFLAVVVRSFDENADDLIGAIRDSARRVLGYAQDNALLHAVVSATHGADTELLPLLTTHAESLLVGAKLVVAERVASYDVRLPPDRLEACIDMVVRLVLSHVMQPTDSPEDTADDIAWIAARVLH